MGTKRLFSLKTGVLRKGFDADHIYELKEGPPDNVNGLLGECSLYVLISSHIVSYWT